GIGTFIKASSEDNNDVGDRYNDLIRINANELSARVIGEGGNLGLTQLARIEFALNGGCINTDFIDNSGGVDCSDREVNLKILLNGIVENGDLTIKQRNAMLREMEAEIADFVLRNNYSQSQSISIAAHQAQINFDLHNRFTEYLEEQGELDRELEFLPTIAELNDRKTQHKGLTRPEIAVLLAYCKNYIKKKLLNSDVPEDPYLSNVLVFAFPDKIRKQYRQQMESHRLRREIISTLVSNYIVNEMGFTFAYQLENETGATVAEVIRAYSITRNIFELSDIWQQIESFDCLIAADIQIEMMQLVARLVWRSTRWFLRHRRFQTDIENSCEHFKAGINTLHRNIKDWLAGVSQERFNRTRAHLIESGVAEELAEKVATKQALISALDIVDATFEYQFELEEVARTYFKLSEVLELGWFREQLYAQNVDNQWEALAREACRDDLDWQQKGLTIAVLKQGQRKQSITERITNWLDTNQHLLVRWQAMLAKLKSQTSHNYVMFTVGLRELMDLTQSALQSAGQEDIMLVANRIDPKFSGVTPKLESAVKISKLKDKSELIANNKQKKTQKAKEK
ncbi:MAG: NAD-glutamate dehydrogenase domain-containing protein, partial [Pseudomonadota bacterium]